MAETLADLLVSMNIDAAQFFPAIEKLNKGLNDFAANARRQGQAANEAMSKAAEDAQAIEDKYHALSITNGDRVLAQRYLSLQREYARELALVDHSGATRLKITAQYEREMAALNDEIGKRSSGPVGDVGPSADKAGEGVSRLTQWFRSLRKEETEQTRSAKFVASQIAEIVPVSNAAALSVGKLAAGFALGAGIGVAVEALKLGVEWYMEHSREAEKAALAAREHARQTVAAMAEIGVSFQRFRENLATPQTSAASFIAGQLDALDREQRELEVKFGEQIEKRRKLRRELDEAMMSPAAFHENDAGVNNPGAAGIERALAGAQKDLEEYERASALIAAKRMAVEEQVPATLYAQHRKIDTEQTKELAALTTRYAADEVRIRKQADAQIADARLNHAARAAEYEKAINANAAEEIARTREQRELAHTQFMRQVVLLGATEEVRIRAEAQNQIDALEVKARQAKHDGDEKTLKNLRAEIAATKQAVEMRLALREAEKASKAVSDLTGEIAKLDTQLAKGTGDNASEYARMLERLSSGDLAASFRETARRDPMSAARLQDDLLERAKGIDKQAALRQEMERFNAVVAETSRVYDEVATPADRYGQEVKKLDELLKWGAIDAETYAAALLKAKESFLGLAQSPTEQFRRRLEDLDKALKEGRISAEEYEKAKGKAAYDAYGGSIEPTVTTALNGFVQMSQGAKSFGDVMDSIWNSILQTALNAISRMVTEWIAAQVAMSAASSTVGGGGSLGGTALAVTAMLADGGPVSSGKTYIVGERGPELFVPNTSGAIVPNNELRGGGSTTIALHVNTMDAASFDDYLARNEGVLAKRIGRLTYKRRI